MENTMIQATMEEDTLVEQLTDQVRMLKVRTEIRVITADMAQKWLGLSGGNRRPSAGRIANYGAAMKNAEFKLNNDLICFDENGVLVNGHHRLKACAESGIPFMAIVAYNMPTDSVYDRGFIRTLGNSLYMSKSVSEDMAGSYAVGIARRYLGILNGRENIADFEARDFLNANEENIKKAIRLCAPSRGNKVNKSILTKAGCRTAILAALKSGVDENALKDFTGIAKSGFMQNEKQSAAVLLRNMLLTTPTGGASVANKVCALTQLAIQDFVNGTPRRRIYTKLYFPYIPDAKVKLD